MKMRKKLLLTLMFVAMLVFMLAISTFAIEITVTYFNGSNIDTSIDGDGLMEIQSGEEFTLPTKTVETGYSFNWYTEDGRAWAGGSRIKLDEDTKLYQVTALDVSDYATFKSCAGSGQTVRLIADITVPNEQVGTINWGTFMVLLNGHNIDFTRTGNNTAIGGQRTGTLYYGSGKITYNGNQFQEAKNHGWGGDCCRLFVGRDVELYAPNAILVFDGDGYVSQGYPYIQIYGKVTCKTILQMRQKEPRAPRVEINRGASVIVKGELVSHTEAGNAININVRGGTIIMENSTYSFFRDQAANYNITGGNILFAEETDFTEVTKYIDGAQYKIVEVTVDKTIYQCIVPYSCGSVPGREHNFTLASTVDASCCDFKKQTYTCENCAHELIFRSGDRTGHNFEFAEKKEATKEELGWEKSVCKDCQSVEFVFVPYDPTNDNVKVVVNTSNGEVTVEVAIKDLYTLEKSGYDYTITGVKAFGSYALNNIVRIYIPLGVKVVNIKTDNSYIKEFILDDAANVTVTSIAKLSSLEKITIKQATVTFSAKCAPTSLKTIDSLVEGADVTFAKEAFVGLTNVSGLNICKGSTYSFAQDSFKQTNIKKLVFPDNANIKFASLAAFYESGVEELYIGKGITNFGQNETFKKCKSLKRIIIMDLTTINDGMFQEIAPNAVVYHHALTLSAGNNSFATNTNLSIYTKAAITNSSAFNSSSYTIHYGIEHKYEMITEDATCEEEGGVAYVTDCSCGVNSDGIYKKFVNNVTSSSNYEIVEQINMITPTVAHNLTILSGIKYENGFGAMGVGEYKCANCGTKEIEQNATQAPIFRCLGYSVREFGGYAMTVKYEVNKKSIENYEAINNVTLEYGMVVANRIVLGDKTPLNDSTASANKGSAKYNMKANGYVVYELTIKNIPELSLGVNYVLSAYIYDGKNTYYLQENETVNNPSGVCFNEVYEIAGLK